MNVVIIGAGQTGRGFIAPIIRDNGDRITFIDKNSALIAALNREQSYQVKYFGDVKPATTIRNYQAYTSADPQAVEQIAQADLVTTSVFASHISELLPLLQDAVAQRVKKNRLPIICCENGIDVKRPLIVANLDAVVSEGIIFCTTIQPDVNSLTLISENYPELPIDHAVSGLQVDVAGFRLEDHFSVLIQRKIYTYNFMSAVVAYLGSYLGYEVYGEAANDSSIEFIMDQTIPVISRIIAKEYEIPYPEQLQFTSRAVQKFRNREIYDTIERNAAQAARKLRPDERLLTPLRLALKYGEETTYFTLMIAAALYYGQTQEQLEVEPILESIVEFTKDSSSSNDIRKYLKWFIARQDLAEMIDSTVQND